MKLGYVKGVGPRPTDDPGYNLGGGIRIIPMDCAQCCCVRMIRLSSQKSNSSTGIAPLEQNRISILSQAVVRSIRRQNLKNRSVRGDAYEGIMLQ